MKLPLHHIPELQSRKGYFRDIESCHITSMIKEKEIISLCTINLFVQNKSQSVSVMTLR